MMKPRTNRVVSERVSNSGSSKSESQTNGVAVVQRNQAQLNNQQTTAQAIRKRRSSINVYDQPSSLNSRLRQLETDMLRLDEDRSKLFDDTHSALAQYELRINEIHAILKSRQDNVEKYVEDMKLLLIAKEEFERQAKLLNEKHDRIQDKFMHRETTISREIKLLKNKFELLEKNRQFRSILQKSNSNNQTLSSENNEDLLESDGLRRKSEATSEANLSQSDRLGHQSSDTQKKTKVTLSRLAIFGRLAKRLFVIRQPGKLGRKSNKIFSAASQVFEKNNGLSGGMQEQSNKKKKSGVLNWLLRFK